MVNLTQLAKVLGRTQGNLSRQMNRDKQVVLFMDEGLAISFIKRGRACLFKKEEVKILKNNLKNYEESKKHQGKNQRN